MINQEFDKLIENELVKNKDRGKKVKDLEFESENLSWALPPHIVTFLATKIQSIPRHGLDFKLKISQWPHFKKEIFDILDHRIEYAAEINGAINNSYMSLDEHLVVYMVHKFDPVMNYKSLKEQNGTRNEV